MTIPHVIEWVDGAPDELDEGLILLFEDGDWMLTGTADDSCEPPIGVIKYAVLIKPHELEWAASMGMKRELGK